MSPWPIPSRLPRLANDPSHDASVGEDIEAKPEGNRPRRCTNSPIRVTVPKTSGSRAGAGFAHAVKCRVLSTGREVALRRADASRNRASAERKAESRTSFDKQAEHYDSSYYGRHGKEIHRHILDRMAAFDCNSVLDVGCGTGNFLWELSKARPNVKLCGLDISGKMLEIAKKRLGDKADLRTGDSEHLPWNGGSFDVITCTDSFHHYPNPKAVLLEFRRVLKHRGRVIIADPWAPYILRQVGNFLILFSRSGDTRLYSKREMERLMVDAGYALTSWQRVGWISCLVVGTAP